MKAMILAAGLGTRLRPLTNDRPKALVTVAGRTLLEIAIGRLRSFGVSEVIVNVHHFGGMVSDYLIANKNFGVRVEVSHEETLLDTGGGLKQAAWFFQEPAPAFGQPFLLHNVDVISTIPLDAMVRFHCENGALATLATQRRETTRGLVFDAHGQLRGRSGSGNEPHSEPPAGFAGIHVLSPQIFAKLSEDGPFSIVDAYIRLAAQGEKIAQFDATDAYWRDLGRPESVAQAERDAASGLYTPA